MIPPRTVRAFRRRILAHYDQHARDLPWRRESDPYRIWVSEVMLQQTRVETVIPYYGRWLARFPDVRTLADAAEDDVLEAWAGLGYYSRARYLHGAARVVRDRHDGALPSSAAALRELPGFGSYTAGAVASIAFGESVPAVDGNVKRVLGRAFAEGSTPRGGSGVDGASGESSGDQRRVHDLARALVDPERPGDFNQALMDLGATICTPRAPKCGACPVAGMCRGRSDLQNGAAPKQAAVPRRKSSPRQRRFVVAVIVGPGGRFLMARRPLGGVLARMWAFPEQELSDGEAAIDTRHVAVEIAEALGLDPGGRQRAGGGSRTRASTPLAPLKHVFTHFTAHYLPVVVQLLPGEDQTLPQSPGGELRWVASSLQRLAVPAGQRRIARAAAEHLGLQVALSETVRS